MAIGVEFEEWVTDAPGPLTLEVSRRQAQYGTGTYSPDDLTELGLRVALFGEENPSGLSSFIAEIPSPLQAVAALNFVRGDHSPRLACAPTEELLGSARAARITEFKLGPPMANKRRLALGWAERQRYVNVEPGARRIEGVVQLP